MLSHLSLLGAAHPCPVPSPGVLPPVFRADPTPVHTDSGPITWIFTSFPCAHSPAATTVLAAGGAGLGEDWGSGAAAST